MLGLRGAQGRSRRYVRISDSYEIAAICRNQRGLNLNEYEPRFARETLIHPAQNRHYSSTPRGSHPHPRVCPTGVGLTRRQVSVCYGMKSNTKSSRYIARRDKSLKYCPQRARSVGFLCEVTLSTRRSDLRHSRRLLRIVMALQWPWERPCSVSCAREWWHSSSGADARSSTSLYLHHSFLPSKTEKVEASFFCIEVFRCISQFFSGKNKTFGKKLNIPGRFVKNDPKKREIWCLGIADVADRSMTRWHSDKVGKSCLRYAAEHAKEQRQGEIGGAGGGRTDTAVDECRNDMLDRVTRCRFDY